MKKHLFHGKHHALLCFLSFWLCQMSVIADDTFFALSASGNQTANDVVVDSVGNSYVAGTFSGTVDFAPQPGVTVNRTASGTGRDLYVAAYNAAGELRWVFHCVGSGSGVHNATGLCLTTSDNIVVCGSFTGQIRFGTGASDPVITSTGSSLDGFVFRLNTSGSTPSLASHSHFRCTEAIIPQAVHSVRRFSTESFAVVGHFSGEATFDSLTGSPVSLFSNAGSTDIFVTLLTSTGASSNRFRLGGSGTDVAMDVTFQHADDWIHVVGSFSGTVDFDPGSGVHNETSTGSGSDGYVATFNQDDLSLVAASPLHCPASAVVNAVEWSYNALGTPTVWIGGDFSQAIGFGENPNNWRSIGSSQGCFFGRVSAHGSPLEYSGFLHTMRGLSPTLTSLYIEGSEQFAIAGGITFGFSEFNYFSTTGVSSESFTADQGDGFLWGISSGQDHIMVRRFGGGGASIVNDVAAPTQWRPSRGFDVIDNNASAVGAFTGNITAVCDESLSLVSTTGEDAFVSRCSPWPLPELNVELFLDVGVTVSFQPMLGRSYRLQQSTNLLPPWTTRADFMPSSGTQAVLDEFSVTGPRNFYRLTPLSQIYPPDP
ncbi:hypothetical protein NT6N_31690 [Oceaniferula spumae]|uniref:Uncharacterized protein n=1 Tax=Oceaniferula spumae TaxID=2979115 RepID=A0AAT9FQE1_9BACT